jgi:tryptophan synthase alpha chain
MNLPLEKYFAEREGRKFLSLFITAGYPKLDSTVPLAQLLADAGADLLELGIPFSDPLADGPTIQEASTVALSNGVSVAMVLAMAKEISSKTKTPIVLMGYFNPILQFGVERFVSAASAAGAQGLIIPDLPVEESMPIRESAMAAGIALIYLAAPNTPAPRLELIDKLTTSFVYAISITGVTGVRKNVAAVALEFLPELQRLVRHPVLVGFGVSTAADARRLCKHCDGVIVGSALLQRLKENCGKPGGDEMIRRYVRELRSALQEERNGY